MPALSLVFIPTTSAKVKSRLDGHMSPENLSWKQDELPHITTLKYYSIIQSLYKDTNLSA